MKRIIIVVISILLIIFMGVAGFIAFEKKSAPKRDITSIHTKVDNYQQKYFEIVKRNNALLVLNNDPKAMEDLKELKSLFDEAKEQVKEDYGFLAEYERLKEVYRVNSGQNTFEMNAFAAEKYKAFDELLNKVYEAIKSELNEEEFKKIELSQKIWQNEVNNYNVILKKQKFGTLEKLVEFDYKTNMSCFRILLLMFYL